MKNDLVCQLNFDHKVFGSVPMIIIVRLKRCKPIKVARCPLQEDVNNKALVTVVMKSEDS